MWCWWSVVYSCSHHMYMYIWCEQLTPLRWSHQWRCWLAVTGLCPDTCSAAVLARCWHWTWTWCCILGPSTDRSLTCKGSTWHSAVLSIIIQRNGTKVKQICCRPLDVGVRPAGVPVQAHRECSLLQRLDADVLSLNLLQSKQEMLRKKRFALTVQLLKIMQ